MVTAAVDPSKKSCSSLGLREGSKECQQKKHELGVDWNISSTQAGLSSNGTLVSCDSSCTHNFVWEETEWLAKKMADFIKNID